MKKQLIPALIGLLLLCLIGWYLDRTLHDELTTLARLVIYILVWLLLVVVGGLLIFAGLIFWERLLKERALRKSAEHRAKVIVVKAEEGQQVFIRDEGHITWRNAHLDTRVYASGQPTELNPIEIQIWQTYQLRHKPNAIEPTSSPLLPAQTQIDLLNALDKAQCALIVGQRDAGKTTVLQHLIGRRVGRSQVVVLDPHSHPTRWPEGCIVIGTERNFPKIERALQGLMALMNQRYREIGRGLVREGEHPSVTVIIDEWRAIVFNLGKSASNIIKTLLAESRKTNIDVFVGTHSERVRALGIEGEGDLKEGFVIVRLTINKLTKERSATVDFGDGETRAALPGPYISRSRQALVDKFVNQDPVPTPEEAQILKLYRAGESLRTISKTVFDGKVGQFYNDKIRQVLEKYGEKW